MSLRTSATRYARALLDIAVKEADPAKVERDLAELAALMAGDSDLGRVLTSPSTPQAARLGIVTAITGRLGVEAPVAKLVVLLADRGRLDLVPDLAEVYRERLLDHQNVVQARVTTAAPLGPAQVEALAGRLSEVTGKTVRIDVHVDPSLIGGLVAQIGSTVYDGSLRTDLAHVKQRLLEEA
jgi:F-type H+-transporting ATPase subunit delta